MSSELIEEALGINVITRELLEYAKKVKDILEKSPRKVKKKRKIITTEDFSGIETKFRIAFGYGGLLIKALSMESFTIRELSFYAKTDESIVRKWIEEAISEGLLRQERDKYVVDKKRIKEFLEEVGYAIIDFASKVV